MNLITNKDNNMNTKELILSDDWEVKEVVDNKIIIREKEKELPKTWKDCFEELKDKESITDSSDIAMIRDSAKAWDKNRDVLPAGMGKPMLALCQLLICRNAWWKQLGWKPDWSDQKQEKYCIGLIKGKVESTTNEGCNRILAFPSEKVRYQFLDSFRDLIEEAKELL